MTTQELISAYQLNFQNTVQKIGNWPAEVDKFPDTSNEELTEFLYSWERADSIDEYLLPSIESVLNNQVSRDQTQGGQIFVALTPIETDLCREDPQHPELTLPTQDFYDIIVLWRNFLLESPLNGPSTGLFT